MCQHSVIYYFKISKINIWTKEIKKLPFDEKDYVEMR